MKEHKTMSREALMNAMNHYDSKGFFDKKRSVVLTRNYGRQNTINICQLKGITLGRKLNQQLRKGIQPDKKDVQVMINLGHGYIYPNEFYNDYLLENILKESKSLVGKKDFYTALKKKLVGKKVIFSAKTGLCQIKLGQSDLRNIIETELPDLHEKIKDNSAKKWHWKSRNAKEAEIEKQVREAIFEGKACSMKELSKCTNLSYKNIYEFLRTTENPLIKLWHSGLQRERST